MARISSAYICGPFLLLAWLAVSSPPPLEVRDGHDSTSGAGCGGLDAIAAVEHSFIVNSVRSADHRFRLAPVIDVKVLERAPAALGDRFLDLCANDCRRSVRDRRVVCAQASVLCHRLSIDGDHRIFPIAHPHSHLGMQSSRRA